MKYIVRPFKGKDAEGVRQLILNILSKEYPFDKSAYSDSDLNNISETYGGASEAFFVIEDDGEIVATAGVKQEAKDDALLRRLFVDVKHRRHGYGSELVDQAISFCRQKGYKKMIFRCTGKMADAMKLCKNKGFKETERLEVGGFNIHKLELSLNNANA